MADDLLGTMVEPLLTAWQRFTSPSDDWWVPVWFGRCVTAEGPPAREVLTAGAGSQRRCR